MQSRRPCSGARRHAQQPQAGFQDGFFIQNASGDTRLVFGLVSQTDGRFSVDDPLPIINTFTTRKFRPSLTGQIGKYFDFKMNPDFGSGTLVVEDAYFDILFSPKFRVRTGKDKTPVGYELEIGDAYVLFPERSLASSLVPNRDTGFQVLAMWRRTESPTQPACSTASLMGAAPRQSSTPTARRILPLESF